MKNIRYMQNRVYDWIVSTFGDDPSQTRLEGYRFIEEAVELVESLGMSRDKVHTVVDYVFDRGRPGEPSQEVGGVMMTLSACASVNDLDIETCWGREMMRCESKTDEIRQKDADKHASVKGKTDDRKTP